MTKLLHSSELMKNQKAARLLPPQRNFEVLQDSLGNALFFSIADDGGFYLTQQRIGDKTGWAAIELTTDLSKYHDGKSITAKAFATTQNQSSGEMTVALAVQVAGEDGDRVYVLGNLVSTATAVWSGAQEARQWISRPYDDTDDPRASLDVAYLHLAKTQAAGQLPSLIVGLVSPDTKYIENYAVSTDPQITANTWVPVQTAENYDALNDMHLGKPASSRFSGLYELYSLSGAVSLTFTPLKSLFGPPPVLKLTPPQGASALAVLPVDNDDHTDLYVAGSNAIYLYSADAQNNFSAGVKIIDNPVVSGVTKLLVNVSAREILLCGLNESEQIFLAQCPIGKQADPKAWSYPVPIQDAVSQLACYKNRVTGSNELFAHLGSNELSRLAQDPVTTMWHKSSILLPLLDVKKDVVQFNTYTTHVTLVDDSNIVVPDKQVKLWSTSPCHVYVNDRYTFVSAESSVEVLSDVSGAITIVQETESLGAVTYYIQLDEDAATSINPSLNIIDKLDRVRTSADLNNVMVPEDYLKPSGNKKPLIPSGTGHEDAIVDSTKQFVSVFKQLPADGSVKPPQVTGLNEPHLQAEGLLWGVRFESGRAYYWEGHDGMIGAGFSLDEAGIVSLHSTSAGDLGDIWDAILVAAGDAFNWLKRIVTDVKQYWVAVRDGLHHFFIELEGKLYRLVLNTISAVLHAVEFVFNKIKVFFEELIAWLGFLFEWDDILRTHDVLKNLVDRYLSYSVNQLPSYRDKVVSVLQNATKEIKAWADLPDNDQTIRGFTGGSNPLPGQHSPQANWGSHHLKSNIGDASTDIDRTPVDSSELQRLLTEIEEALKREGDVFEGALKALQRDIIGQFDQLSVGDLLRRLIAIVSDVLVDSTENLLVTFIDVLQILIQGLPNVIDSPIDIPVISWLYHLVTGDDLTLLDLSCLVVSIPVTITLKLLTGETPFPNNAFTSALKDAQSFEEIRRIFTGEVQPQAKVPTGSELATAVDQRKIFAGVLYGLAFWGSIPFAMLTASKAADPGPVVAALHGIFYLVTTAPSLAASLVISAKQTWWQVMAEVVYGLSVVQKIIDVVSTSRKWAFWDEISAHLDGMLGCAGVIPALPPLVTTKDAAPTIGQFLANVTWNLNLVVSPWADLKESPEIFGFKLICIRVYGVLEGAMILFVLL